MTIGEFCEKLERYHPLSSAFARADLVLERMAIWENDTLDDLACLYICDPGTSVLPTNALFIGDVPSPSAINSICLRGTASAEVLLELGGVLLASGSWEEHLDHLFLKKLRSGATLQDLTDYASVYLGNPFYVCNTRMQALSATSGVTVENDSHWKIAAMDGCVTPENSSVFKSDTQKQRLMSIYNSPQPLLLEELRDSSGELIHGRRINFRLSKDSHLLGHMTVVEHSKEFAPGDFGIIRAIAASLVFKMAIDSAIPQDDAFAALIIDIIDQRVAVKDIDANARYLFPHLHPSFLLLTASPRNGEERSLKNRFQAFPHYELGSNTAFLYRNNALLLINFREKDSDEVYDLVRLWCNYFSGDILGMSQTFDRVSRVDAAYRQCLKSIELGEKLKPGEGLHRYKDYFIYHVLELANRSHSNIRELLSVKARAILEFDREYNTFYKETLLSYFNNRGDLTLAAKELHVHRNTLNYRLQKIESIFSIDLSDGVQYRNLELSLRCSQLLDIFSVEHQ